MDTRLKRPKNKEELLSGNSLQLATWSEGIDVDELGDLEVEFFLLGVFEQNEIVEPERQSKGEAFHWFEHSWLAVVSSFALVVLFFVPFYSDEQTPEAHLPSLRRLGGDRLRAKGETRKRVVLRILHSKFGQTKRGRFLRRDVRLSTSEHFSVGFHLFDSGGYVSLYWYRKHEPFQMLYENKGFVERGKMFYIQEGGHLIKFSLKGEAPGLACLYLLQTKQPLRKAEKRYIAALKVPVNRQSIPTFLVAKLGGNYIASKGFCMQLSRILSRKNKK
jgi:hypothetical protein